MKLGGTGFYTKLILKGERSWRGDPCSATELQACSVSGDWKLLAIKTSRGAYCSQTNRRHEAKNGSPLLYQCNSSPCVPHNLGIRQPKSHLCPCPTARPAGNVAEISFLRADVKYLPPRPILFRHKRAAGLSACILTLTKAENWYDNCRTRFAALILYLLKGKREEGRVG